MTPVPDDAARSDDPPTDDVAELRRALRRLGAALDSTVAALDRAVERGPRPDDGRDRDADDDRP